MFSAFLTMMPLSIQSLLVCPTCKAELIFHHSEYQCGQSTCANAYPIAQSIPVLIDERLSTFDIAPYLNDRGSKNLRKSIKQKIRRLTPRISKSLVAQKNLIRFRNLLLEAAHRPVVLVIGGATAGDGMRDLLVDQRLQFLETDVTIGPRTQLICDANYLPLRNESVDGVIVQAVLEYIPDPPLCVQEVYRVLKPGGLVYSEMPFMQHVHGGRYDFTRLTHLGHRRLFRHFSEIESGACAGPATSLAWSIQNFFLSFLRSPLLRDACKFAICWSLFWLKYLDYLSLLSPGALDAACGTYFLARKSESVFSDRELIAGYRGAVPRPEFL